MGETQTVRFVPRLTTFFVVSLLALLSAYFAFTTPAHALQTIPYKMNFQGKLTNPSGIPLASGTYNMKFRIFDATTGGTQQWTEQRSVFAGTGVTVTTGGLFSVQLGDVTSLPPALFTNQNLYFEVELPTPATATCATSSCESYTEGAMTPRNKLGSSAYAFNSDTLDGLDSTAFAAASGSANYIQNGSSPQTANFNVTGTGTATLLQATTFDAASTGTLTIGGANATAISMVDNVTVGSGLSLTLVGSGTRPASPSEGMVYYDTTTKQLLTYANSKWQADGKDAVIVAASNGSAADKASADYIAAGTNSDQVAINTALMAANPAGSGRKTGKVVLLAGTYTINASISIPNSTALIGSGAGTVITIPNALNTNFSAITNTDQTAGADITIQDLRLEGNKLNQSGTGFGMSGIEFNGMGGGSGSTARSGVKIIHVRSNNWYSNGATGSVCQDGAGICLRNSANSTVSDSSTQGDVDGLAFSNVVNSVISGNTAQGNLYSGLYTVDSSDNTISNNVTQGNGDGLAFFTTSDSIVTGNIVKGSDYSGLYVEESHENIFSDNVVQENAIAGFNIATSSSNTISGNKVYDNGGTTDNNGIYLSAADSNNITNNTITDTSATTTNYAISISNSTADANYLADNGLGGGSINDIGTGTIFANQISNSGVLMNRSSGGLVVQNASNQSLLTADTSTSAVDIDGTLKVQSDAAGAVLVQNSSSTDLFRVDASTNRVTIGAASANPTLLVLGNKTNEDDPTGVEGATYYNGAMKAFRCYAGGMWNDCDFSSMRSEWVLQEDFRGDVDTGAWSIYDHLFENNWSAGYWGTQGTISKLNLEANASDQDRMGVVVFSTGANANSGYGLELGTYWGDIAGTPSNMTVEFDFATENSNAAAGTYQTVLLGLHDGTTEAVGYPDTGMYFKYDSGAAASTWQACTSNSGTNTCTSTGVGLSSVSVYQRFKIRTNAAGNSVKFYINEALVATNTTNLPTATTSYGAEIKVANKTGSSTAKSWKMDYFQIKRNLSTLR